MTRVWLVPLLAAATLSCSDTTTNPAILLNLNRPVDIAFACYGFYSPDGVTQSAEPTAMPPAWCNLRSPQLTPTKREPQIDSSKQLTPAQDDTKGVPVWYGFILQSASGTVAVSVMPSQPDDVFSAGLSTNGGEVQVVDADPRSPGKNAISVGEAPVALVTDLSGCFEVTANAGSCDLSDLDINTVLTKDSSIPVRVVRKDVVDAMGNKVGARPAAMVVQPNTNEPFAKSCPVDGSSTGLAYIAYPGCHVVAGVDLLTKQVKTAIDLRGATATVMAPADVARLGSICRSECAGEAPDAGVRPVTLSLQQDTTRGMTTRLAIGADNSATITVVDLDNTTLLPAAGAPLQIALEPAAGTQLGVTSIALSPQIAMGNSTAQLPDPTGTLAPSRHNNNVTTYAYTAPNLQAIPPAPIGGSPGGEGQYVYAVATDGTVRVADVLTIRKECDTQVDTRFVRALTSDADIPKLQCFPVGDPATPRRRIGARGPGIVTPSDGPPLSVAILKGLDRPAVTQAAAIISDDPAVNNPDPDPVPVAPQANQLIGYFAAISVSSGLVYIVNIDDDDGPDRFDPARPIATAPVLAMAHQLRDSFTDRGAVAAAGTNQCTAVDPASTITGGPRSSSGPGSVVPANTIPAPRLNELPKSGLLPSIRQEKCEAPTSDTDATPVVRAVSELQLAASAATRDVVYPDLSTARSETWALTWQGNLSNDPVTKAIDGPPQRTGQLRIDQTGLHLVDGAQPFCELGVEPFDYVQLRGCNAANADADCPSGYICYVHKDNRVPNLGQCMRADEAPRLADACKDFLTTARRYSVRQSTTGELTLAPRKHVLATTPVDGCVDNAQCTALAGYAAGLRSNDQPGVPKTDLHAWGCAADDSRAPVATGKRCVETCTKTEDCEAGTICDTAAGQCMESVLPPQACINGPQRFEVHASDQFVVTGTGSGFVHPLIAKGGNGADANACVRDPAASPLQIGRIPLNPPACNPAADPITGALQGGGFEPNPCSTTVDQLNTEPSYTTTCVPDSTPLVPRTAPAVKFRNRGMTIHLVDPWTTTDLTCVQDRKGPYTKIPLMLEPFFDSPVVPGFQIQFDQKAGFNGLAAGGITLAPALPVKLVRGPSDSLWVMDDGDVLATAIGQQATRGQVYRVSISSIGVLNLLR